MGANEASVPGAQRSAVSITSFSHLPRDGDDLPDAALSGHVATEVDDKIDGGRRGRQQPQARRRTTSVTVVETTGGVCAACALFSAAAALRSLATAACFAPSALALPVRRTSQALISQATTANRATIRVQT